MEMHLCRIPARKPVEMGPTLPLTNERIAELVDTIVKASPFYVAARACGFDFGMVQVRGPSAALQRVLQIPIRCICGNAETFNAVIDQVPDYVFEQGMFDPMEQMARIGTFSEDHLLKDGYPPDFAKKTGRLFETIHTVLRWRRLEAVEPRDLQGVLDLGFERYEQCTRGTRA